MYLDVHACRCMPGLSWEIIRKDICKDSAVFVIGLLLGIIAGLSAFLHIVPVDGNADAARYLTLLLKSTGIIIPAILGLGSAIVILIMPKRTGDNCRQCDMYSHVLVVMAVPAATIAIMFVITSIAAVIVTGGADDIPVIMFAYAGMFAEAAGFAALGTFGYSMFAGWGRCMTLALVLSAWCVIATFLGSLGIPGIVLAEGIDWMSAFYGTTFAGLIDVDSLLTLGTSSPGMTWFWKYLALAAMEVAVFVVSHFYCRFRGNY